MRITRKMLRAPEHINVSPEFVGADLEWCEHLADAYLDSDDEISAPDPRYVVWEWKEAPEDFRKLCCWNGGDEDWLVLTRKEPEWLPPWIEALDTCREPDVYLLTNAVIYVGSHS